MTAATADDRALERELVERVRALLGDRQVQEKRMFGVVALMVDDALAVAVHKDGTLLVRVDSTEDARLLQSPGAARAEMGSGRSMGAGWIRVEGSVLQTEEGLLGWVEAALRCLAGRHLNPLRASGSGFRTRSRS